MPKMHPQGNSAWAFWCPGCRTAHGIRVPAWGFDGDIENPTIEGSINAIGLMHCHSYVENGQIRFLQDCDHALAGTTVDLPGWRLGDGES